MQANSETTEHKVTVQYVEIYMEKIRDLLDRGGTKNNLEIRAGPEGGGATAAGLLPTRSLRSGTAIISSSSYSALMRLCSASLAAVALAILSSLARTV